MEIKVLGCSGGRSPDYDLTSYLIDDTILIDTGAAAGSMSLEQQEALTDVLVTHSHLDHIMGLAFILDNTRTSRARPIEIYGTEPILRTIRENLLTSAVMPFEFGERGLDSLANFHAISLEIPFWVGPYEIEAFPVFHQTGSVAFRVSDSEHTMLFTGDTGKTDRVWQWLKNRGGVDCLIAEASFPDHMEELADVSRHLTPEGLVASLDKAGHDPEDPVYVVHLKPSFMEQMVRELAGKEKYNLIPLEKGHVIELAPGSGKRKVERKPIEERVRDKVPEFNRESDLYRQRDRLVKDFGTGYKAGEVIFRQGDKSKIMYIVQEGKVRIYRQAWGMEKTLSVLGQGDFFGEMAMLNNTARSASALALTDVKLLAFDRQAFENLIVNNFGIAIRIIHTLAQRLQESDAIIENLLYIDPHSKVINTLIQAAIDEGIETSEGYLVRTTPEKLSDQSGVVVNTLRDILTDLVNERMVLLRREAVIVPDITKLRRLLKFLELKDEFA